jgi:hypothetical protein
MIRLRRPSRRLRRAPTGRRNRELLAAATALAAPPLAFEIYLEHYKGSFGDKWMWTPIVLTPPLTVAGLAAIVSRRAARTVLPAISALYAADGLIGLATHIRGLRRRPGGRETLTYNLVMGPPLLAPGALLVIGALGLAAPFADRDG